MKRCLLDASVLIDLDQAGLLDTVGILDQELFTVDLVAAELRSVGEARLGAAGVACVRMSGEQVAAIIEVRSRHGRLSTGDAAALVGAKGFDALLLTGDARLREAAEAEGVEVHGTLWLLRECVRAGLLDATSARDLVDGLRRQGRRLPASLDGYFER